MHYLIVLSALLSLATAVMAQGIEPADEGDDAYAMRSSGHAENVSATVPEQDMADDYID